MNIRIKMLAVLLFAMLLQGCMQVKPEVPLTDNFWESTDKNIAIAVIQPETADFYPKGDIRLLDYAIITAAMSDLQAYIETIKPDEFAQVREVLTKQLVNNGYDVKQIEEQLKLDMLSDSPQTDTKTEFYADKNFTPLAEKYNVNKILLLNLQGAGVARNYNGFFPLDDPHAYFSVEGQLIDLKDNRLLWNSSTLVTLNAQGNWDEPPAYPGLTESFYIALETVKAKLVEKLAKK